MNPFIRRIRAGVTPASFMLAAPLTWIAQTKHERKRDQKESNNDTGFDLVFDGGEARGPQALARNTYTGYLGVKLGTPEPWLYVGTEWLYFGDGRGDRNRCQTRCPQLATSGHLRDTQPKVP